MTFFPFGMSLTIEPLRGGRWHLRVDGHPQAVFGGPIWVASWSAESGLLEALREAWTEIEPALVATYESQGAHH